jgi:branched-chain amino acid transport system substrate-binding protein
MEGMKRGLAMLSNSHAERRNGAIFSIKDLSRVAGICSVLLWFLVSSTFAGEQVIKIGVPLPLSGPKAKFGELHHKSYLLALEEINTTGGIRRGKFSGYSMAFLFEDTLGKPEKGKKRTEKLISELKVPMIMGGYSSDVVYGIARTCEKRKTPFISPSGAADRITQQRWRYTFRLNPPASEYASGLHDFFAKVVKPETMIILYEKTRVGTLNGEAMKRWCEEQGVGVLMFEAYKPWNADFRPILGDMKARAPDVIYMVSHQTDAILLARQAKTLNIQPRLFAGSGPGFGSRQFVQRAGGAAENIVSAALWMPNAAYLEARGFVRRYMAKYGTAPDYHGAQAYSAAQVCRNVVERTKSLKAGHLLRALGATHMRTTFGPVKFASYKKFTNQNRVLTLVLQIQGGKFQTIWPPEAATASYTYPAQTRFNR